MSANDAVARAGAAFPGVPIVHLENALSGSVDALLQSVRTLTHTERRQVARTDVVSYGCCGARRSVEMWKRPARLLWGD
jgi:hypothetical protein